MHLLNLNETKLKLIGDELLKSILLEEEVDQNKLINFLENYESIFKALNDRIVLLEYYTDRYFNRIKDFEDDLYNVIEKIQDEKNFHQNYMYLGDIQNKLSKIINDNTEIDKHD